MTVFLSANFSSIVMRRTERWSDLNLNDIILEMALIHPYIFNLTYYLAPAMTRSDMTARPQDGARRAAVRRREERWWRIARRNQSHFRAPSGPVVSLWRGDPVERTRDASWNTGAAARSRK